MNRYEKIDAAFDEKFWDSARSRGIRTFVGTDSVVATTTEIKQFIHTLLDEQRETMAQAVEGLKVDELGVKDRPFYGTSAARSYAKYYNRALTDAIAIINGTE